MNESPSRVYAGSTQAERQARRRAALVDAAFELIGEGGIQRISAIAVCKRAGLNQRYFTESFRNTEELLVAAIDRTAAEALEFGLEASGGFAAIDSSRAVEIISALIDFVASDPGRKALMIEMQATPTMRARRDDFVRAVARIVETKAVGDAARTEQSQITSLVLTHGALDTVTMWLAGTLDISREALISALAGLMTAEARSGGPFAVSPEPPQ